MTANLKPINSIYSVISAIAASPLTTKRQLLKAGFPNRCNLVHKATKLNISNVKAIWNTHNGHYCSNYDELKDFEFFENLSFYVLDLPNYQPTLVAVKYAHTGDYCRPICRNDEDDCDLAPELPRFTFQPLPDVKKETVENAIEAMLDDKFGATDYIKDFFFERKGKCDCNLPHRPAF